MKWGVAAWSVVLFSMSWNASLATSKNSLTASAVLEHIEKVGPQQALQEYWASGEFEQILDGIGTANSKWLEVYTRLRPVSDAGASEDLGQALAYNALPRAPFKIMLIERSEGWSAESVCTFGFDDTCPPDGITSYLNRLERALRKAKTPWEKSVRDICIKGIRTARHQFPKERAIHWCRYGAEEPNSEKQ